jgi:hypothetical protein
MYPERFKDVHEPIIERPRWELMQSLLAKPKKRTSKTQRNIFSGLLRCADCGGNLTFHFNQRNNDITYYSCHAYNGLRKTCPTSHYVRTDFLEKVVLADIKRLVKYAALHEDKFAELLRASVAQDAAGSQAAREQRLTRLEARERELDALFERIYEDRAKGLVSEERFIKMSGKYEGEQAKIVLQLERLRREAEADADKGASVDDFLRIVKSCADIRKLTPRILHLFVDYITVHQAERVAGGWQQRIDIHYNFVGTVSVPVSKEIPEPVIAMKTRKGVALNYSFSSPEAATPWCIGS